MNLEFLKKKGYRIKSNWQDLSLKSIYFINTTKDERFIYYQKKAIKKKCKFILCNKKFKHLEIDKKINYFHYSSEKELIDISHKFYPINQIKIIFVTGTDGKTSIAYGCHKLMNLNQSNSCYIGTIGFFLNAKKIKSLNNTTPHYLEILDMLDFSIKQKAKYAFIEASSIGFCEGRLGNIQYDYLVLTNLKSDHLDYHKTIQNYHNSKINLIKKHAKENSKILVQDSHLTKKINPISKNIIFQENFIEDNQINLIKKDHITYQLNYNKLKFSFTAFSDFVSMNILTNVILFKLVTHKIPKTVNKKILPPGRSEIYRLNNNSFIIIDYAHTPYAFKNLLGNLSKFTFHKIIIFGCGGDRDKFKRSSMASIASKYTDLQIITDDNPRSEDPSRIRNTLMKHSKNGVDISSRSQAIKFGIKLLNKKSGILIIAGKGHEQTQIYKNKVIKFNDLEKVKKYAQNI
jgi:UDP-N-acetylmuramyl-tripeptide synthetase